MVDEGTNGVDGDQSMEEPGLFDSVCAFCDDGGDILWYDFVFSYDLKVIMFVFIQTNVLVPTYCDMNIYLFNICQIVLNFLSIYTN